MLAVLREIILDHQQTDFDTGIPRHLRVETLPGKATICIGVRRCGKSTYLFQRMRHLQDAGVPRENMLYLNFFDDRLHPLRHEGLNLILEAYYGLYPEKKDRETLHVFFDEIQAIPGWEAFVDRLLRSQRCEVFITGSSAQMLSREIATQMRGRALAWELFPFSFTEFLDARGVSYGVHLASRERLQIRKAFEEYRERGGFPEVLGVDRRLRIRIHQEYLQAILFRDLIERHDIAHPQAVSELAHWLIDNAASLYSINRLTGYLKSLGYHVPKSAVADYLEWFEDAYFLFTVPIHDASVARTRTNPKKIYCIDHALIDSVASGVLVNAGHRLENLIFVALRRHFGPIRYYRTRTRKEVDFIVRDAKRSYRLIQVCESLGQAETRQREIAALEEAMAETGNAQGIIVTAEEEAIHETTAGRIHILPAWKFVLLLDLQELP